MALSPDEMAGLMPPLTPTEREQFASRVTGSAPPDNGSESEFLRRLANSGRRMVHDPRGAAMLAAGGMAAGAPFGLSAAGGALGSSAPLLVDRPHRPDGVTVRDGTEQLSTAPAGDVPVEQAPALAKTRADQFRAAVMGGGTSGLGQLRADWMGARQRALSGLDTAKELEGRKGVAQADKIDAVSDLLQIDAAKKRRDAELQAQQDEAAHQRHQQFLARNTELADDIGKQQIDPRRLIKSKNVAQRAGDVLGSVLGGFAAGLKGGPNEFLDRFDKQVTQDIDAQQSAIDNKKASLSARQGIFAQMLAETGDRRLAALQTRNLMYEAAKQELGAEADRLGIPEVLVNADIAKQAIQQQQDKLNEQYAHESYATAQHQAAAAAAAQRAAEDRAWQRKMEVAKLGLEQDKLEIEKAKALSLTPDDLAKQTQALGKEMSDQDLAEGREAVESIKRRIASAKPDEGLPGVGRLADFRARLRPEGVAVLNPMAHAVNAVAGLSDEERVSRNDWQKLKLSYQKKITGSGASDKERETLSDAFEGAKSPAEQRAAIAQADAYFARREAAIKAGFDPRAVAAFESRLSANNPQLPSSVRVKR